jgi:uroporphyrinogen-III synthase
VGVTSTDKRIVVQEHGQSLSMVAHALRRQGADVTTVTVYRVASAGRPGADVPLIDLVADRKLDAVTFTSAPAVAAMMEAAGSTGRRDELVGAFQADVSRPASDRSPRRRSRCGACRPIYPERSGWPRW